MARSVLLVGLLIIGLITQAGEASLPPEVRRDLQNIRKLTSLDFNKTISLEPVRSLDETIEAFEIPHIFANSYFAERRRRMVWQGGRFYQDLERRTGDVTRRSEHSYDGFAQYLGTPGNTLGRSRLPSGHTFGKYFFAATGLSAPPAPSRSTATSLESMILHRLETDGRLVSVSRTDLNGRNLVEVVLLVPNEVQQRAMNVDVAQVREHLQRSITPQAQQERELELLYERRSLPPEVAENFFLDPALNHAVVRIEQRHPDGTLL